MHQYPSNWDIRKIGSLQIYINTIQTGMWGWLNLSIYIYASIPIQLGCMEDWISPYIHQYYSNWDVRKIRSLHIYASIPIQLGCMEDWISPNIHQYYSNWDVRKIRSLHIYMHQYPSNWDVWKIGSLQIYFNTIQTGMWGRLDLCIHIILLLLGPDMRKIVSKQKSFTDYLTT